MKQGFIKILIISILLLEGFSCRNKPDKLDFWMEENNFIYLSEENEQGDYPVIQAVKEENLEIIELLVQRKVELDVRSSAGETPLGLACEKGNLEIVKILMNGNVDVNFKVHEQEFAETPLHLAIGSGNAELVNFLLLKEADPNASGIGGMTPLHTAVLHKNLEMVKMLIEAGADIDNLPEQYGQTPLQMALKQENLNIAAWLIEHGANSDWLYRIEPGRAGWFELGMTVDEVEKADVLYPQAEIQKTEMMSEGESVPILELYFGESEEVKLMMLLHAITSEVCRIEIYSPDFLTDEGLGIGSDYQDIIEIYGQTEIFWGEGGVPVMVIEPAQITFVLDPGDWWGDGNEPEIPPDDTKIIKIYLW